MRDERTVLVLAVSLVSLNDVAHVACELFAVLTKFTSSVRFLDL